MCGLDVMVVLLEKKRVMVMVMGEKVVIDKMHLISWRYIYCVVILTSFLCFFSSCTGFLLDK